jgi:hypothetical protein
MISIRRLLISIVATVLFMPFIFAQDLSTYRKFQLGMDLVAAAKQANANGSDTKVICQRPATIQEMEWRPQISLYGFPAQNDPVKEILLGFYNGKLYRIVVFYDMYRTEGLTDEDMIDGISAKYGTPTMPVATISSSALQSYNESEKVIARWEDSQYSVNFFRSSYGSVPGMLIFSKSLDTDAQAAIVEGNRLNDQEAPAREIERQKKVESEKDAAGRKARVANKPNFRP